MIYFIVNEIIFEILAAFNVSKVRILNPLLYLMNQKVDRNLIW